MFSAISCSVGMIQAFCSCLRNCDVAALVEEPEAGMHWLHGTPFCLRSCMTRSSLPTAPEQTYASCRGSGGAVERFKQFLAHYSTASEEDVATEVCVCVSHTWLGSGRT